MEISLVPAAQYLRMSTDLQQYSLHNQADAIARYAALSGFRIVKTYSDAARSGLLLKNRAGLKQLLKDVGDGQFEFRAVLVYDVSRWGRFQDMDESAHYEYLCKSAGAPVYYCAELFGNCNNLADFIMKALKRMMAGEYSRELSVKVRAGLFRLATMGYRVGGPPPYGLRRQLIDSNGNPKQILEKGQYKSISTDRVVLVPTSPAEITTVKRVFHEFVSQRRNVNHIAKSLNQDGIRFLNGARWAPHHVTYLLKNPLYCGMQVWGRNTARLKTQLKRVAPELWATCPGAFHAMISQRLFNRAQERFANFTCRLSKEQLLQRLQNVLKRHGRLSSEIIERSPLCPNVSTYYHRFGGLSNAYRELGIIRPELISSFNSRQMIRVTRKRLIESLLKEFPDRLKEERRTRARSLLKECESGVLIELAFARYGTSARYGKFWFLDFHEDLLRKRERITVLGLLSEDKTIEQIRVFPTMSFQGKSIRLYHQSDWLQKGTQLNNISDFLHVLEHVKNARSG